MGLFHWGEGQPLPGTSLHERMHHKVAKALGVSGRWEHNHRENASYWASWPDTERKAAIIECAGYLTGGGDDDNDRRAAIKFCKIAKIPLTEAEAEARRLMR